MTLRGAASSLYIYTFEIHPSTTTTINHSYHGFSYTEGLQEDQDHRHLLSHEKYYHAPACTFFCNRYVRPLIFT